MDIDTKIRIISQILNRKTQIYILYNYELCKLIINIYLSKYVSNLLEAEKCFS